MSSTATPLSDFYKILQIHRTASKQEIKEAYRKIALALHPDRHDGCEKKAEEFKLAAEAYNTLLDSSKRRIYDESLSKPHGHDGWYNKNRKTPPPPDYRKVYTAHPPPGFKIFDNQRHYNMHYGDGMMKEEIERARQRAEAASNRSHGYDYVSPLGKGFSFDGVSSLGGNPYSKSARRQKHHDDSGENKIEYEEAHFYDWNSSNVSDAQSIIDVKNRVANRMVERKKYRTRNRGDPVKEHETSACSIM